MSTAYSVAGVSIPIAPPTAYRLSPTESFPHSLNPRLRHLGRVECGNNPDRLAGNEGRLSTLLVYPSDSPKRYSKRPSSMSIRKRHHFLPVFYLNRFLNPAGRFFQFDLRFEITPNPIRTTPQNVGVESYLYSPGLGPDPRDETLEAWLGKHVDAPAAPVVAKLCDGQVLSTAEQYLLSRFLVAQRLRTPSHRDLTLSDAQRRAERLVEEWRQDRSMMRKHIREAHSAAGHPPDQATAEINHWEALFDSGDEIGVSTLKTFWLNLIAQSIKETSTRFGGLQYLVFEPPSGREFCTSDSPVLRRYTNPLLRRVGGEPGWLSPATEISLPLAPDRMLLIGWELEAPVDLVEWWETWRRDLLWAADRFLISRELPTWVRLELAMNPHPA